jgi:hypothetical protein
MSEPELLSNESSTVVSMLGHNGINAKMPEPEMKSVGNSELKEFKSASQALY